MNGICGKLLGLRLRASTAIALLVGSVFPAFAHDGPFPPGFQKTAIYSGFYLPVAVRFAPDGHVFIIEKYGKLFAFDGLNDNTATVVKDFEPQLWGFTDHGMLGLAVDPQWPTRPYLYVMYALRGSPGGRISRIEINPATDQMVGNEVVLMEGWCNIYQTHSIGDLHFGPDGALYASAGEGASPNIVDWGQDEPYNVDNNPAGPCTCNDPLLEGGALRSQDLRTSGDPVGLSGTVIRIDPNTGQALPDNPLYGGDPGDDRIIAYGLRNPFRFTIDQITGSLFICDVGWNTWEEINYIPNPLATPIRNFGWPCYEGPAIMPAYYYSDLPICNSLVTEGSATPPFYAYQHVGGAAATGAAIYEGGNYPTKYVGALFLADYGEHKIRVMYPNAQGVPDPATIEEFAHSEVNPVDLQVGPNGDLFYIDINIGSLRRIEYVGVHDPPTAVAEADVTNGPSPLTVQFNALNSTDPNNQALTYGWDFDNDGDFSDSTDAQPMFVFQSAGNYPVSLKVTNEDGLFDVDTVTISVDNGPPTATITLPDPSYRWRVGDEITFAGGGTDPDTGPIGPEGLSWEIVMKHCYSLEPLDCHDHTMKTAAGVDSGSFLCIDHEYPCAIQILLTVSEPGPNPLTDTATITLEPEVATITLATQPAGLNVGLFTEFGPAPVVKQAVVNGSATITAATPQVNGDTKYTFVSWSSGGGASHNITVPATDTTYTATFSVNQRPALGAVDNKTGNEGELLEFNVTATDPDGTTPILKATNLPPGAVFADHGDGTATFSWTPTHTQAGTYANVNILAVDANDAQWYDAKAITITIDDVNQAPVLAAIGNRSVDENALLQFTVSATDPDGPIPSLGVTNLPSGASFVDHGDGTGTFSWTPSYQQSGTYPNVTFTATDAGAPPLNASESITITVNDVNRAPSLAAIGNKAVNENALLQFTVSATDPDGTNPSLGVTNLPSGASFVDHGDGTGTFSWTPSYQQSGTYPNVTFTATDAGAPPLNASESITITVNDVNPAPVLAAIGDQTVSEGQILQIAVSAADADGTTPVLAASNMPAGASFVDHHNGTGTFTWATTFTDAGTYPGIVITATDALDMGLFDQESFKVTVTDSNRKPVIDPLPNLSVNEADTVQFIITASDPDGTTPSIQCTNLPANAGLVDYGDGSALFDWVPSYDASDGSPYQLHFVASDGLDTGETSCTITVANANRPVFIEPIGGKNAVEGQLLSFVIYASSYDVKPVVTAAGIPPGAKLVELETGNYAFLWTPDYHAAEHSPYNVKFTGDNGESQASETVRIDVADATAPGTIVVNRPKAGATWTLGSDGKLKIKWTSAGNVGNKVSIELWRKGQFVAKIKAATKNDGAFGWDVPLDLPTGAGYTIRVISKGNPLIYGASNGSFTIKKAKSKQN